MFVSRAAAGQPGAHAAARWPSVIADVAAHALWRHGATVIVTTRRAVPLRNTASSVTLSLPGARAA